MSFLKMIRSFFKRKCNRPLEPKDHESGRYLPLHFDSWGEAYYAFHKENEAPLFEFPLEKIINITGTTFSLDSAHPFIIALSFYSQDTKTTKKLEAVLESYYDYFQPLTIPDLVGVSSSPNSSFDFAKKNVFFPWDANVRNKDYKYTGPRTVEMVKSTLKRLTKIYDSIKVNGYNPRIEKNIKDTFPSGQVLLSDSKGEETPFFLLKSGHHRLAALSALGYETVTICFRPGMPPVVREEEVEYENSYKR